MGVLERLCQAHARRRLEQAVAERRPRLYRIAYSWCGDRMVADDLVQESLERALRHHSELRDPERLDAWLHSILHNCWRQHLRRRRPDVALDEALLDLQQDVIGQVARLERIHAMRRAILDLPVLQREVVTLVDLEGFSYAEVAEILDIPIGTVMSRLNRARQGLCRRLMAWQDPEHESERRPAGRPAARLVRSEP
ncbi:MAG: RNA polymerase sigma factor [Gammaproteobacteria bacterium]|nr:MAG: RNA polymerase sigma factor [Gammaproteobacteria bacterium]